MHQPSGHCATVAYEFRSSSYDNIVYMHFLTCNGSYVDESMQTYRMHAEYILHLNGNRRVKCYHISKSYSTLKAFIILTLNCFSPLFPDWSISITALFLQLVRYLDTVCWQWNTYRYILPLDGYTTLLPQ